MSKRKGLRKSKKNKVLTGLVGGVGEFFDLDPVLLRLVWLLVVLFTGVFPGIITYIIAIFIVPEDFVE